MDRPCQRHDRCLPARLHRFQLIARKETYRLAVRAPEWVARAIRATNRPAIDRGQRSHKARPAFEFAMNATCRPSGDTLKSTARFVRLEPSGGRWKLDVLGRRRRHATTVEQHRSTQRQSQSRGNNPAEARRSSSHQTASPRLRDGRRGGCPSDVPSARSKSAAD